MFKIPSALLSAINPIEKSFSTLKRRYGARKREDQSVEDCVWDFLNDDGTFECRAFYFNVQNWLVKARNNVPFE